MSSANEVKGHATRDSAGRKYLKAAGGILLLLIALVGALQSGIPASYFDPYGLLFVLVGGVSLILISFPGATIGRAFRQGAKPSGSNADLRDSARFWEAAGRGFWMVGGLSSVLSMVIGFVGLRTEETAGLSAVVPILIRPLLSTFYGSLLAVICFVPCWKLLGMIQSRPTATNPEHGERTISDAHHRWRVGSIIGYVLFLSALIWTSRLLMSLHELWSVYRPSLLVVLGGTLALLLYKGETNTRLTPSAAFAGMGLIGCLMGFIQMLHGMTNPGPQGIGQVAGAIAFVLFSCFTALLGMALIGAPLEDRAIRTGQANTISAFSRVSWYVFPLLSLIFLVVVFNMIIMPLGPPR